MSIASSPLPAVQVTPAALEHIRKIVMQTAGGTGARLAIKNTGCSGKSYVVSVIEQVQPEDYVLPLTDQLVLCIDPGSYALVKDVTIDYVREGLTGKLVFDNPQSKAACGCGESFYV